MMLNRTANSREEFTTLSLISCTFSFCLNFLRFGLEVAIMEPNSDVTRVGEDVTERKTKSQLNLIYCLSQITQARARVQSISVS